MAFYIDPFGAPEFLVDDVAFRQMIGTEFVRFGFFSRDEEDAILRVKVVFPMARVFDAQRETVAFLRQQVRPKRIGMM